MRRSLVLLALALWAGWASVVAAQAVTTISGESWEMKAPSEAPLGATPESEPPDPVVAPGDPPSFRVSEEASRYTLGGWLDWLATAWRTPFGNSQATSP